MSSFSVSLFFTSFFSWILRSSILISFFPRSSNVCARSSFLNGLRFGLSGLPFPFFSLAMWGDSVVRGDSEDGAGHPLRRHPEDEVLFLLRARRRAVLVEHLLEAGLQVAEPRRRNAAHFHDVDLVLIHERNEPVRCRCVAEIPARRREGFDDQP